MTSIDMQRKEMLVFYIIIQFFCVAMLFEAFFGASRVHMCVHRQRFKFHN